MIVKETDLPGLTLKARGKVRDIYDLGEQLLIVTTDRMSAFDVIMDDPIPDKGKVLNGISAYWFEQFKNLVPNHLLSLEPADVAGLDQASAAQLEGRMMLVKKAEPLPVECIVRGYLVGSGYKDYLKTGKLCDIQLEEGLKEAAKFEVPLFTPSTKAELGEHDENISFEQMAELVGPDLAREVRDVSLGIYTKARDIAAEKGIIIADTKFEFGLVDGALTLIDEVLTPDSSRFWPADQYSPGRSQPSFDKQFLRDYLSGLDWDKTPPPPKLPQEIIDKTRAKYIEAMERLTGLSPS